MESLKKTIFVKYKNPDGTHTEEAKRSFVEIVEDRFNPMYHRKLFLKNLFQNKEEIKKLDLNNPWVVTVVGGVIVLVIAKLIT